MPGKVKVKVVAGRSLPVMDRSNDTTDAYVEVKLGAVTHKTDVCRKSLNPQWNSEWFRFEMDDLELQDEPLQIRLMDYDTYSANDAIGKVYLDLNPLLITTSKGKDNSGKMISGWIPVYDTMHGIRGEVNLIVKVELFSDLNKYRQSSCGVRFFFTQTVPEGYIAHTIQGFVEELVVNDDPEYQWIDKIRTPRASNEARQTLFSKLSGEVQRKVGLKALELGGNAVIGYKQCLDLEGESGIVVRGIGTAIFLTKLYENQLSPTFFDPNGHNRESPIPEELSETPVNTSTWINKCATTNTNTNVTLSSSPPPPLPSISNTSTQINNNNTLPTSLSPLPTPTPPPPLITASSGLSPNSKENNKVYIANGFTTNNSLHQESNTTPVVVVNPNNNKQVSRDERDSSSRSCSDSPDKEKTTPKVSINISNRNHTNHHSNSNVTNFALNRRSSESDLSTPPKGGSGGSGTSTHLRNQLQRGGINFDNLEMQEFPFMSISQFPPGFIYYMGGTVTARSVKLLDRISNFDEPESRDSWWNEIRMEMRSHCRAFGCTVLLGYEERTTMCDDVCVLSASGTAAVVVSGNLDLLSISTKSGGSEGSKDRNPSGRADSFSGQANVRQSKPIQKLLADKNLGLKMMSPSAKARHDSDGSYDPSCGMLHIPRNGNPMPTTGKKVRCAYCRKGRVPDILLSTIEIPSGLHTSGRSCLIQAQVFRPKKDVKGETSAKEISDSLPFLEYELHRRLINKLKVKGMNAIFGLQVQICLGEKLMVGIATGTAVYLTALPPPTAPVICAGNLKTDSQKVVQFQKVVQETFEKNREIFRVKHIVVPNQVQGSTTSSDGEDSEEELQDELLHRNKDTFVLEVDDAEDIDIISMLIDPSPPVGYNMNNVETLLGFDDHRVISQQMFNQIWRCRIPSLSLRQFTTYFDRLIRSVTFKLRRMQPCVFSKLSFRIDLPEQDEMQLSIIGMAIGMDKKSQESCQLINKNQGTVKGGDDFDMIFPLEEDANGEIGSGSKSPIPGGGHAGQIIMSSAAAAAAGITSGGFGVGPGALKSSSSSPSGGGSGNAGAGSTTANVTLVNPLASGNGNVSSSCISVVSSCSSTTSTSNNGTSGTSQSDGLTSSVVASNSKESTTAGVLSQANSYSVRHPHSRSARFMTMMMMGAQKPMPAPVSRMRHWVEITPLSYIHGTRIEKYLGNLNFFFIRETTSLRESGGLSGFVHNFITEILAIVRAHVAALGGNAMVSYFMTECSLLHNPHKNQGQCVVNVGGDAVFVSYPGGGHPEDGIS